MLRRHASGWSWGEPAAVRSVQELGWVVDLDPELVRIWDESTADLEPEGSAPEPSLLKRALLLSIGSDCFLLDPGRVDGTGEWASCGFTSWYPGAGEPTSSFRAGMDGHYANFVRFTAPESMTRAEVAAQVPRCTRPTGRACAVTPPRSRWSRLRATLVTTARTCSTSSCAP